MFFLVAASKGRNIKTCDVKSGSLQGAILCQDVFKATKRKKESWSYMEDK